MVVSKSAGKEKTKTGDTPEGFLSPSLFEKRVQAVLGATIGGVILAVARGFARTMVEIRNGVIGLLAGIGQFRDTVLRQLLVVPADTIDFAFAAARGDLGTFGLLAFWVAVAVVLGTLWVVAEEVDVLG